MGELVDLFGRDNHAPADLFRRDCLMIAGEAQSDVDTFARVGTFVILSIRQPFIDMRRQMRSVALWGNRSPCLFGWKREGHAYILANAVSLHRDARRYLRGEFDLDSLVYRYMDVPGLGITKANFLAQLTVGTGACLDMHNLNRLGLRSDAFAISKTVQRETMLDRIRTYRAVWQEHGTSASWWQYWCEYLARNRTTPTRTDDQWFKTPGEVSAMHRVALPATGKRAERRNKSASLAA